MADAPSGLRRKRVAVLCQLDGFANGRRPEALRRVLTDHGHDVELIDTHRLSRARSSGVGSKLPAPTARGTALYLVEALTRLTRDGLLRRWSFYPAFKADQHLRRSLLAPALQEGDYDLVIAETAADAAALLDLDDEVTLFDCPTPWADELLYEGRLSAPQHQRLRHWEIETCAGADHVAYHWRTYGRYAVTTTGISPHNLMTLDQGCDLATERATHRAPLRVAYMGSLSSRFIDLPLLARLSRSYPHIDVYGGPAPDPSLGLNFCGYATPEVLAQYQAGLITCTKDELRCSGFSAKHLEYLAHGLPVLVPAWRRDLDLLAGSIPYDESTFARCIDELADPVRWQSLSEQAVHQARALAWENTLEPLVGLLDGVAWRGS